MTADAFIAFTYLRAFRFLSLDATTGLFPELGLMDVDAHVVRSIARDISRPSSSGSREDIELEFQSRIGEDFRHLSARGGAKVACTLRWWIEDVFDRERNPWAALEWVVTGAAGSRRRERTDVLNLGSKADQFYSELARAQTFDYESVRARYDPLVLTVWDRMVYDVQVEYTPSVNFNPLSDEACLCIVLNRFQVFWERSRGLLEDPDFDELTKLCSANGVFDWPTGTHVRDVRRRLPMPNEVA